MKIFITTGKSLTPHLFLLEHTLRLSVVAALFAANAIAAPGIEPSTEPTTTDPARLNATMSIQSDQVDADCQISCHPWYRFCQFRPYSYKCSDSGRFQWGRYHSGCERQCLCGCDSK